MEEQRDFERDKLRLTSQLDIIKDVIKSREQILFLVAANCIALIALANLIEMNVLLRIGITALLLFSILLLWFFDKQCKQALISSQNILFSIIKDKENEVKEILDSQPWSAKHFNDIVLTVFTIIIVFFIYLLWAQPKTDSTRIQQSHATEYYRIVPRNENFSPWFQSNHF